jgi:dTDP-4-amino-4,6-dideoxygalactose transaminase
MDEILAIAKEYNLIVIEDACHALGADYKGQMIGTLSDMTVLSFHPVKHITTGEGGMILTESKETYERLKLFRTHGITRQTSQLEACEGPWYYEQQVLGYNYRITDIQCALGISQMRKIDSFVARRRELAARYDQAFQGLDGIRIPYQAEDCHNSWHLYVIQVLKQDRKEVFEGLIARNIGVNVHYIPVHTQPYYREHGYAEVVCPNAELAYSRFISLPMYAKLTDEEQDYVIEQVKSLI